jgi:hypothetical protein
MKLIFEVFGILFSMLNTFSPFLLPFILTVLIVKLFKGHSIIIFTLTSMLSAFIDIFVWLLPNLEFSKKLEAGNTLLSIASIQNFFDLILNSYIGSLPMWTNFIVIILGSTIVYGYFKLQNI